MGWGLETTPETLVDTDRGMELPSGIPFAERCARVRCPVLIIHGDADANGRTRRAPRSWRRPAASS